MTIALNGHAEMHAPHLMHFFASMTCSCFTAPVMALTGHQTLKEIDRYAKAYFREKKKASVYEKWRTGAARAAAKAEATQAA